LFDCANTLPASPTALANRFDFSALGLYRPADVTITRIVPAVTTVDVKKTGQTVIRISALNSTLTQKFRLTAQYVRPFDESAAAKQFGVSFCRTATDNGACLAPASPNSLE